MPVYLITLHAYATWMPDRPEGSIHWQRGYQERDDDLAAAYRKRQREPAPTFDEPVQRLLIDTLHEGAASLGLDIYAVATDPSHLHLLCAWTDEREARFIQSRLKHALTQRLNERIGRRTWFTRKGHLKRVHDREHLDHLLNAYLPSHKGRCWDRRTLVEEDRPSGT